MFNRDELAIKIMLAMIARYGIEDDNLDNIVNCLEDSRKAADKLLAVLK